MIPSKTKSKIVDHSLHSLYRMNTKTATHYAFTLTDRGRDWEGQWCWDDGGCGEEWVLELKTLKVKRAKKEKK
ncbi:MAG: hypothetical protein Q8K85_15765 [Hyphomicrobium sp.]|nr:hypothetical protein [Hyphomicrobium sp.]